MDKVITTTCDEDSVVTGLDLGDKYSFFHDLSRDSGATLDEGRVRTTKDDLWKKFSCLKRRRIAFEIGTHSPWVSRLLESCGHEVLVANPRKLRLIYQSPRKTDRLDAMRLARVARMDTELLAPIRHRGAEAQADLAIVRSRYTLVTSRTMLINHIRGAVKSFGGRLPRCSTPSFAQKSRDHIPEELRLALSPVLDQIEMLTASIREADRKIESLCTDKYPETALLRQVDGVGPVTALTYILTLEDPARFRSSRAVGSYLGLTRREDSSGESSRELRITKAGDADVRRLLVGAAHYVLGPFGPDCDLRRWGMDLSGNGHKNAKKRAIVAVARKLAVLLHRLWLTGEVYEPLRKESRERSKSRALPATLRGQGSRRCSA